MDMKPGETKRGIPRGSCLRKLGRGCGWALLGLLLLSVVLYCVEYYKGSRYTPTGDELFDRYARAVIRRQAPRLWFTDAWAYNNPTAYFASDRQLAQWEDEFGNDPRYWQLRIWNSQSQGDIYVPELTEDAIALLRIGYERGAKDAMLVLLLARLREGLSLYEVSQLTRSVKDEVTPEKQERIDAVRQATIDEVEPLYAEAIELAPGQAWPYYERALSRLGREDYAGAEADFAAGNVAPLNDAFMIYPQSVLREQLLADPCEPNATLFGLMRSPYCCTYNYDWFVLCGDDHKLCGFVEQQPNSTLNAEFHRFLCRVAQEHGEPSDAVFCLDAARKMALRVMEHPALAPEQQATLLCASTIPRKAMYLVWAHTDIAKATSPHIRWLGYYSFGSTSVNPQYLPESVTEASYYFFPRLYYSDGAWIEHVYIESADDYLTRAAKQLAELDYTTLVLPEAWREGNLELPVSDETESQ